MTDIAALADDPAWLPHRIDAQAGQVEFLKLPSDAFADAQFLADYTAETASGSKTISLDQLSAMVPTKGPLHFIFHTAFCRSTLLVRAMNIAGVSAGLSEPHILANLNGLGQQAAPLIASCMALLSRPHGDSQAVLVKPTNHANRLLPALMQAVPEAKAIMMSNSLPAFLASVNRKGLMGRRWARNLYLEVQAYAPLDLGIEPREMFLLSDMQVAGLAWMLQRRWFEMHLKGPQGARMRSLDSDDFNADVHGTLRSLCNFTELSVAEDKLNAVSNSALFTQHSKLGGAYDVADEAAQNDAIFDQEAQMVGQWIGTIAGQAGLAQDLPWPLQES